MINNKCLWFDLNYFVEPFAAKFDLVFRISWIAANKQVLPMVGELKDVRPATEVHYSFKD